MAVAAVQPPWATLVDPADGAWVRAANFAIACQAVRGGDRLVLTGLPDEHLALLVGTGARIETASGVVQAPADALVIVEPGDSAIEPDGDGRIVRVVTTRAADVEHRERPEAVRPLGGPVIGPGTRVHALADHPVGEGEMRVFRSGDLMMNVFGPRTRRRDPARLSPHWHDDFEQGSIVLAGSWIRSSALPMDARQRRMARGRAPALRRAERDDHPGRRRAHLAGHGRRRLVARRRVRAAASGLPRTGDRPQRGGVRRQRMTRSSSTALMPSSASIRRKLKPSAASSSHASDSCERR